VTGTTVGLPATLIAPCGISNPNTPEAKYEFTAPADGTYTFSTSGSSFDTILYLEVGSCGGATLSCNDDFGGLQSQVQATLTAGETILVVVDGYNAASGSFTLSVQ
jgi:hypothetical protein